MPDTGFNGYISINPDGTVVTPINLTPDGVIAAGDLATVPYVNASHDDAVAVAEGYTDNAVSGLAPTVDSLGQEVIRGGPTVIAGQYSFDVDQATGGWPVTFFVDYDFGPAGPPGVWPTWTINGYLVLVVGEFAFIGAQPQAGNVVRFIFVSLANAPQACQGTFYFDVAGSP